MLEIVRALLSCAYWHSCTVLIECFLVFAKYPTESMAAFLKFRTRDMRGSLLWEKYWQLPSARIGDMVLDTVLIHYSNDYLVPKDFKVLYVQYFFVT
jgi:hypothetical protein